MFVVGMTSAQRNIVLQYLNRRDGLRYYTSAKPMSSFDITGNRRRKVLISDTGLSAIAQNCPKVTSISLSCSANVTSIGLLNLTRGLPHLSYINIANCRWLTNADLVAVGQNCNRLRTIDLSNTYIGDEGVVGIANNCPLLSSIYLNYDLRITKVSLIALVEKCPEMKKINLYNIKGLDEIVSFIRRRYPHIHIQNDQIFEPDYNLGGGC